MNLVAFLGTDKENWGQIAALMNHMETDKIILAKNKEAEGFPVSENCNIVEVDSTMSLLEMKRLLIEKLKALLGTEFEVALSLASGTGKEHMALLSALLSIPVGVRLVVYTKQGVELVT
jgi:hypothetical protein